MNECPSFPAFEITGRGDLSFHRTPDTFKTTTYLALLLEFYKDLKFYDSEGYRWSIETVTSGVKVTFLNKLLAHTIYNPIVPFTPHWRKDGSYKLEELKSLYIKAVRQDDDILTQFVEEDGLIQRVNIARSIKDLISVAEWMEEDNLLGTDEDL